MFNYSDPILNSIAETYHRILQESHPRKRLVELSKEELDKLKAEYKLKAEQTDDKDKAAEHKKEYDMIVDILKTK